jgi:hypothetical protein
MMTRRKTQRKKEAAELHNNNPHEMEKKQTHARYALNIPPTTKNEYRCIQKGERTSKEKGGPRI